jgi:glycerol-3-phosphate acyltransferase PlsX
MSNYVIAVDTLGGDPYVVGLDGKPRQQPVVERAVQGAVAALNEQKNIELVLIGNADAIQKELDKLDVKVPVHIEPAETYFNSNNFPASSLNKLIEGIGKDFDGGLTIGDTTKIIQHIAGKLHDFAMPNVDQLPLAEFIKVRDAADKVLYLDMGANMVCRANHLYQFAQMARIVLTEREGLAAPKIGILTVGSEVYKGNRLVRKTMELCEAAGIEAIDVSRAEPRDAELGKVNAIVTDGHTGNLLLKALEAKAETILGYTKHFISGHVQSVIEEYQLLVEQGKMQPAPELVEKLKELPRDVMGRLIQFFAFEGYGAATLHGLRSRAQDRSAILKKGHGVSDANAFRSAVLSCRAEAISGLTERMQDYFTNEYQLPNKK